MLRAINLHFKKSFSSSLVYNILDNHSLSLESFFELRPSELPTFDSLSRCMGFAHKRALNQNEESVLGFFDDKNGVQEEISSRAVVQSHSMVFDGSKFWAWKHKDKSLSKCNVFFEKGFAATSENGSSNFIFGSFSLPNAGIRIVENQDLVVDDCIPCQIHLENVLSDAQTSVLDDSHDLLNEVRQNYWFAASCMLLEKCQKLCQNKLRDMSVETIDEVLSTLYCLETILSIFNTQFYNFNAAPRLLLPDSVALKSLTSEMLSHIYCVLNEPEPDVLKLLPNFYGNDNVLSMASLRTYLKQYWAKHKDVILEVRPDTDGLKPLLTSKSARENFADVKKIKLPHHILADPKCGYIHSEIKKIPGIVGGIDLRMSLLQHFIFETMRYQGHNDNIYYQHYLQGHIMARCHHLYLALAVLNRLNHVMFNKERIENENQLEAEQAWAYRCIETCFDKFDSLSWKVTRRDVNFNYSLFNKQGKETADKRELQFVHAMFPSAY